MNPLKLDPTRTTTLRRRFSGDLNARFNVLKKELRKLLVEDDAFGLKQPKPSVLFNWSDEARAKSLETRRRNALMKGPKVKYSSFKIKGGIRHDVHLGGKNIGFSVVRPNKKGILLHDLHVAPEMQGRGLAKKLMQDIISQYGGKEIRLRASPHYDKGLSQKDLMAFYAKFGFVPIKGDFAGRMIRKPDEPITNELVFNTGEWRYLTDERKLEALKKWLQFRVGALFLKQEHDDSLNSWLGAYIKQAHQQGLRRAWNSWKRPTGPLPMSKEAGIGYQQGQLAEFMRQSFGGPTPMERVRLLATRTFDDLQGVTESMSHNITRELLDGIVMGINPRDIGVQLNKLVDGYKNRGTAIARTEVVRAFNEGALDGYENMGAKAIGVMVEWTTSGMGFTALGNPSPCKKCAPLANLVLTIEEARGLLPRHPNCMCSFVPANVGEKTTGQIRDAARIRKAIAASAAGDKRWMGGKKKISSKRPEEVTV